MKKLILFMAITVIVSSLNAQSYNWKPTDYHSVHITGNIPEASLFKECPVREGCTGSYAEMTSQVASFMSCMSEKYDVILDAESITYDTYEPFQAGTVFCWGFLHHARYVLPPYLPVSYRSTNIDINTK